MKKVLTIAGSDCSGGAGIQADIKTITAHNMYAMSVITSVTAQNTTGVYGIADMTGEFVDKQLSCVFDDIYPDAVKIGMVSDIEIIETIARALKKYEAKNVVVDPVMVSTSKSKLLKDDAIDALKENLFPLATVITPNISEAEVLSGITIHSDKDMIEAAKIIANNISVNVLIKGGHSTDNANDLLYANDKCYWFNGKRIDNPNTHGTGCTLSSAIACNLALGYSLEESVSNAKGYITKCLSAALDLGHGSGPLNHMA